MQADTKVSNIPDATVFWLPGSRFPRNVDIYPRNCKTLVISQKAAIFNSEL